MRVSYGLLALSAAVSVVVAGKSCRRKVHVQARPDLSLCSVRCPFARRERTLVCWSVDDYH